MHTPNERSVKNQGREKSTIPEATQTRLRSDFFLPLSTVKRLDMLLKMVPGKKYIESS